MASDYQAITAHNERQLGLDTSSRKTQICMYSDSSHFIYEILQNADDYGATEVSFRLTQNELTVEHNGRSFSADNVKAITYFGKSTSRDDLVKTGRFGVGFKSVFAFTATPIIISGQEHFKIHGLYRVSEHPYPEGLARDRTRIILPFNHATERPDYVEDLMPATEAYNRISARLTGLNMHTLLFTHNIREILWDIEGTSGHYLREDAIQDGARRTTITDGKSVHKYLVFARTPTWRGQSFKDVEIAFGVDDRNQIAPIQDFLYVLFATTQETHLQFVVNGPYRTNPSRETISEDDPFNGHLMKETCELLTTVLPYLRDSALLTPQFLGVLPNATDNLRSFYSPLLDAVVERFRVDRLVPTDDDKYAPATDIFQGPAAIREVITPPELSFLSHSRSASWAKGVTQNTRPDQFLRSLKIQQWGWDELQNTLEIKYGGYVYNSQTPSGIDSNWLQERSDAWLQRLYMLLGDAMAKEDCNEWTLQRCKIIRVIENGKMTHVAGSKAYFPKGKAYRDLPQIKPSILRGKTKQQNAKLEESLVALGVREIGDEERIDLILETYYREDSPQLTAQQHLDHVSLFIKWWKKESSADKFERQSIFRVTGKDTMVDPSSCYLDTPIKATGLSVIYKESRQGVPDKHRLWARYRDLNGEGFCDFAVACGVGAGLLIEEQSCYHHPKERVLRQDYNQHGIRFTGTGIDEDFIIPGLNALLRLQDVEISRLVWDTVRKADPQILEARFRPNRGYEMQVDKSSLVLMLAAYDWIPDKGAVFHKPTEITRSSLHPALVFDDRNGWLSAIGFEEKARKATEEYRRNQEFAKALGVSMEIVDQLNTFSPEERNELQAQFAALLKRRARAKEEALKSRGGAIAFHAALTQTFIQDGGGVTSGALRSSGASRNPERRQIKLEREIAADIEHEPSPESRFTFGTCKKWKGKNDTVRMKLLAWYAGQCQICGRTFMQRNQEPYFEGIYLVPYTEAEWIDRPGNVLCLCPWHSAMFQFGSKEVHTDITAHILGFSPAAAGGSGQSAIELTLCGTSETIKFHEDHFLELKVMIQESQKAEP